MDVANEHWCEQDLVEIEDWNEYGELKQHVTIYYDDFTQPTKAQAAAMPQPLRRGPVKPAATAKPAAKPTATAVPPAPPMPEKKEKAPEQEGQKSIVDTVKDAAAQVTLPIRGIAEEAAAKAKDMRLQSLREKVYGKGGKPAEEGRVEEKEDTTTESKTEEKDATLESKEKKDQGDTLVQKPAPIAIPSPSGRKSITSESPVSLLQGTGGMQSPTTGAWKHGPSTDDFLRMLQSPTSTSWKPTDVDEPIKCYRGSLVQTVSEEEIEAIEKAEMIEEDPEAEEEAEEEDEEEKEHKDVDDEEEQDDEDDDEEEDESEEDAKTEKKPAEVKPDEKK